MKLYTCDESSMEYVHSHMEMMKDLLLRKLIELYEDFAQWSRDISMSFWFDLTWISVDISIPEMVKKSTDDDKKDSHFSMSEAIVWVSSTR